MLASIFGVTGLIVWIVVIVAVIALLKGKKQDIVQKRFQPNALWYLWWNW